MASDFLSIPELRTHLYEEIADEITRGDDAIIEDAIKTAIAELKGFLTKYDLAHLFAWVANEPYATKPEWLAARDPKLLSVAKDVAAWHLIRLANPNIELGFRRTLYEDAASWLRGVQSGKIDPLLLPAPATGLTATNAGSLDGTVKWESNNKRNNHF